VSWNNCYSSFEKHVVAISGDGAPNCGFFTIEASEPDKAKVRDCLEHKVQTNNSFRVGHQSYGDDSLFCDVAIKDTSGKYWSFMYDSDISGGSGGPATIWVSECKGIKIEPGTIAPDSFFHMLECNERKDIKAKLLRK